MAPLWLMVADLMWLACTWDKKLVAACAYEGGGGFLRAQDKDRGPVPYPDGGGQRQRGEGGVVGDRGGRCPVPRETDRSGCRAGCS
jgi:hypothetical protein